MNTQRSQSLARKATALLSAIAASSFLGLPALAGGATNAGTTSSEPAQTTPSADRTQCAPTAQSSRPADTATPDAAAPDAAQLPNQADPRAGLSATNQSVAQRTDDLSVNQASNAAIAPNANSSANSDEASTYGYILAQGGATAGGFANQQVTAARNPDANRTVSSRYRSNQGRISANRNNETPGNAGMVTPESMRAGTMSQPANQSSQTLTGTTIAQCPTGITPRSATPDVRQVPNQPGTQVSPQPIDPQMRQSPADDNGSRAR